MKDAARVSLPAESYNDGWHGEAFEFANEFVENRLKSKKQRAKRGIRVSTNKRLRLFKHARFTVMFFHFIFLFISKKKSVYTYTYASFSYCVVSLSTVKYICKHCHGTYTIACTHTHAVHKII